MGPTSWTRVLALAVMLAVAIYALLYARQATEPARAIADYRERILTADAQRLAATIEARLARAQAGVRAAGLALRDRPGQPGAALELAGAVAPGVTFAVTTAGGELLAPTAAAAADYRTASPVAAGRIALSEDRRALLVSETAGSPRLIARVLIPEAATADGARLAIAAEGEGVIAATAADLRGVSVEKAFGRSFAELTAAGGRNLTEQFDDHKMHLAVAPIGESGLLAIAATRVVTGPAALLDDIWVLGTPLALGLVVGLFHLLQRARNARASREWADTERRFRIAVEGARCGVWEWDLDAAEVVMSDYMAALFGFSEGGAVPAETVMARIHPRYREPVTHALRQAQAYGAFETSFPVQLPEGAVRWIDARGQAHGERGDTGFSTIVGVALDITEARRVKAQAQAAESRLRDGIESVSDAFVLFDRHGRLILWNEAFKDAFGFDDQALKRGALKDELNKIAALAIRTDQPSASGRAGTREIELHDGRWLQLSERFTRDGGSVVSAADLTLIKQQEAERQKTSDSLQATVDQLELSQEKLSQLARQYEVAMTRAEAANQAKSEFLANMSHELRTPLNAINGFSEIMAAELFGPLGDARYKGYAKDILQSGQHLLSLINDILDMAKIEAGKLTLHYEAVSMDEVCEDAIRLMRGRAQEAGLKLALETSRPPEIQADYRALKQVLLNLLSNALKFTPEGGRITVVVSSPDEATVKLAVTDTGIGIAPEDLSRLAQPFEQVEGQHSKTTQGTGLGLALTKSLIEMHHGSLTMESEPGHGTTASVILPIRRPAGVGEDQADAGEARRVRAA